MIRELQELKIKINKNAPFYMLKQVICSELKTSPLKNILLQTYELGIPADLLINQDLTDERKNMIVNFLRKEFLMDKNAAILIVKHWIFLLGIDDYNESLQNNPELANEFLGDYGEESTQSKVRLVGYRDIEVNNEISNEENEVESKLLSNIFLDGLKKGDLNKVKKAVKRGFSIDFKDKGNRDALMIWITKKGYLDILSYLVEKGLDIKSRFENGRTALMYVAKTEHLEIFNYMVSLGLKVDDKDDSGKRVLMYATEKGFLPVVKKIVSLGADINIGTNGYAKVDDKLYSLGKTALMYSIASKNQEIIEYLLDNGADIFATKNGVRKNKNGEIEAIGKNVIMYAVEHGDLALVKYLVSKGALLLNVKDEYENNSLVYAVIKKDIKMVKYLISKGVSVNKMNKDNLNPLIYAIKVNELNIVKHLVSEGAILDGSFYSDKEGELTKPIHYAIKEGNEDIIKFLLSKAVNINEQDSEGKTPLMYLIEKQNVKLIKQFLAEKPDVEILDNNENDALYYAKNTSNNKIISLLENYIKKDYR